MSTNLAMVVRDLSRIDPNAASRLKVLSLSGLRIARTNPSCEDMVRELLKLSDYLQLLRDFTARQIKLREVIDRRVGCK